MNNMHESNKHHWDQASGRWQKLRDEDGLWRSCHNEPELAFAGGTLGLLQEVVGPISGKDVCIIGSGDNYAAFALAGMGANVVSTDISGRQLEIAARRAEQLDLAITFVKADAANLEQLADSEFDLVFSSNGFFVWISDLQDVFHEAFRVLRPGGHYVFYDIHPFQRPWNDQAATIEVEKPYWETGPFEHKLSGTFEFHWTFADILNSAAASGFALRSVLETPAQDSRFWQDDSYHPGTEGSLMDWTRNPRAALPVWLTAAFLKLS